MKKKLLVLLIAAIPTLMPNLASAIAIDTGLLHIYPLLLKGGNWLLIGS
jgi:hypothetical protein